MQVLKFSLLFPRWFELTRFPRSPQYSDRLKLTKRSEATLL